MVRIGDLKIGRKYDFEAIALEDGSYEGYVEQGVRDWTGWLLGITPNSDDSTWTLFLKDDEGCDLYIRIAADYNDMFQRPEPQRTGDVLTNMLLWVCNLEEDSSENEEENNNGGNGEGNEGENEEENEGGNEGGNGGNGGYMNGNWGGGGRHLRRRRQRKTRKQKRKSRNSKKTRRAH